MIRFAMILVVALLGLIAFSATASDAHAGVHAIRLADGSVAFVSDGAIVHGHHAGFSAGFSAAPVRSRATFRSRSSFRGPSRSRFISRSRFSDCR